jgi:hypothetical protein
LADTKSLGSGFVEKLLVTTHRTLILRILWRVGDGRSVTGSISTAFSLGKLRSDRIATAYGMSAALEDVEL